MPRPSSRWALRAYPHRSDDSEQPSHRRPGDSRPPPHGASSSWWPRHGHSPSGSPLVVISRRARLPRPRQRRRPVTGVRDPRGSSQATFSGLMSRRSSYYRSKTSCRQRERRQTNASSHAKARPIHLSLHVQFAPELETVTHAYVSAHSAAAGVHRMRRCSLLRSQLARRSPPLEVRTVLRTCTATRPAVAPASLARAVAWGHGEVRLAASRSAALHGRRVARRGAIACLLRSTVQRAAAARRMARLRCATAAGNPT